MGRSGDKTDESVKNMVSPLLLRQRGASLVESMIALTLIAIVGSLAAVSIGDGIKQMRVEDAKATLTLIGMRLRDDLSNPDHLRTSADILGENSNPQFLDCVDPSRNCVTTESTKAMPFHLYKLVRMPDGTTKTVRISGSIANPVLYNTKGEICTLGGRDGCLFQAYAFFWATCNFDRQNNSVDQYIPAEICKPSQMVNFRFVIEARDSSLPKFLESLKGAKFPSTGSNVDYVVRVPTYLIVQKSPVSPCGPGQFQDGYKKDGRPRCFCSASVKGTEPPVPQPQEKESVEVEPHENCDKIHCAQDQLLIGFDKYGNAMCKDVRQCTKEVNSCAQFDADADPKCPCECIPTETLKYKQCGAGQWITGVNWGQCEARSVGKKGGEAPVTCNGGFMLCCNSRG